MPDLWVTWNGDLWVMAPLAVAPSVGEKMPWHTKPEKAWVGFDLKSRLAFTILLSLFKIIVAERHFLDSN